MSAFIVGDETINKILAFINADCTRNEHIYRPLEIMNLVWTGKDAGGRWGAMMLDLNIDAVCARYSDEKADVLKKDREFEHSGVLPPSRIQAFKSLRCWLYQCSEGDVPETALFKAFDEVSGNMAHHIVSRSPEFEAATWG